MNIKRELARQPREPSVRPRETCASCALFLDDPAELERVFAGINALSSAFGSTRGRAGICGRDGSFRDPIRACDAYEGRAKGR